MSPRCSIDPGCPLRLRWRQRMRTRVDARRRVAMDLTNPCAMTVHCSSLGADQVMDMYEGRQPAAKDSNRFAITRIYVKVVKG
jgi:hypothetical protein